MDVSDDQLSRNIRYELDHDRRVDAQHLHVTVHEAVAVLSGSAPNLAAKQAALQAAARVADVRHVFDGIAVDASLGLPDDTEIAQRVRAILALDAAIPPAALSVQVDQGVVTITGTVDWDYQREAARSAAARVAGVKRVRDEILVSGPPSTADLRGRILAALERHVESQAAELEIRVVDGVVRLEGALDGAGSRAIAEQAARSAPGVIGVENALRQPEGSADPV